MDVYKRGELLRYSDAEELFLFLGLSIAKASVFFGRTSIRIGWDKDEIIKHVDFAITVRFFMKYIDIVKKQPFFPSSGPVALTKFLQEQGVAVKPNLIAGVLGKNSSFGRRYVNRRDVDASANDTLRRLCGVVIDACSPQKRKVSLVPFHHLQACCREEAELRGQPSAPERGWSNIRDGMVKG